MKIEVIGVATNSSLPQVKNWEIGLTKLGLNYKLLGEGMNYINHGVKQDLYKDYINTSNSDIFIMSDVYDVIPNVEVLNLINEKNISIENYILKIFGSFNAPIVVGGEQGCNPFKECYYSRYFNIYSRYSIYPNSGMIMGYKNALMSYYDYVSQKGNDDQYWLGYYHAKFPELIKIDTERKLFFNYFFTNNIEKNSGCHILSHFPGMKDSKFLTILYKKRAADLQLDHNIKSKDKNFELLTVVLTIVFLMVLASIAQYL